MESDECHLRTKRGSIRKNLLRSPIILWRLMSVICARNVVLFVRICYAVQLFYRDWWVSSAHETWVYS